MAYRKIIGGISPAAMTEEHMARDFMITSWIIGVIAIDKNNPLSNL
ncbi:MAG: hypothetical protein H6563_13490 [Lewinellaceae bacterium]|nr:hypothetical protein [Lewinellaceae bacterium]